MMKEETSDSKIRLKYLKNTKKNYRIKLEITLISLQKAFIYIHPKVEVRVAPEMAYSRDLIYV